MEAALVYTHLIAITSYDHHHTLTQSPSPGLSHSVHIWEMISLQSKLRYTFFTHVDITPAQVEMGDGLRFAFCHIYNQFIVFYYDCIVSALLGGKIKEYFSSNSKHNSSLNTS